MAKLMWIAGILLAAVGLALGLMIFFSPASIVAWGISADTAVIMIVGGILSLGIGGVINALETGSLAASAPAYVPAAEVPAVIPEFGRRTAEAAAAATATVATAAAVVEEELSPAVKQTIEALDQAKHDLQQAFEPAPAPAPEPEPVAAAAEAAVEEVVEAAEAVAEEVEEEIAEAAEEEVLDDGQLYVVEERIIRGRPARILSDSTVEAETDEGWMRFENLEHLDEYLEAMSPSA